jgi:CBS domain-containing protein
MIRGTGLLQPLGVRMKTVLHVLHAKSGPVLSVPPDATVYDALALMARHDIGALVVIDADGIAGMFSERDYARKVILQGKSSRDLPVAEVMTRQVLTVTPHCTVDDCMAIMTDHRVRHLPVLDGSGVIGIMSIGDVVKALLDEQRYTIEQLEHYIAT